MRGVRADASVTPDTLATPGRLLTMGDAGILVVLRGNSGSGKSTVARMVQQRFDRGTCLIVEQDRVRREMLRERDVAGALNIHLIEAIATWGLDRGLVVVVDGILNRSRYQRMLERLRDRSSSAHFFAWDLEFAETVRRHGQRPQRTVFTAEDMAPWYHGWNPLDFVEETKFDAKTTAAAALECIATAIAADSRVRAPDHDAAVRPAPRLRESAPGGRGASEGGG